MVKIFGKEPTKKVADERTMKISDLVEMVGRRYACLTTVQLRSLVSIVAENEAEKQSRHHLCDQSEQVGEEQK